MVTWSEITGTALKLCVVGHDEMTEDDWQRLISASKDDENEVEGLPELVSECMKLCGFDSEVKNKDEVDGVLDSMGESPS